MFRRLVRQSKGTYVTFSSVAKGKNLPQGWLCNLLKKYLRKTLAYCYFKLPASKVEKNNKYKVSVVDINNCPLTSADCIDKLDLERILQKQPLGILKHLSVGIILTLDENMITSSVE